MTESYAEMQSFVDLILDTARGALCRLLIPMQHTPFVYEQKGTTFADEHEYDLPSPQERHKCPVTDLLESSAAIEQLKRCWNICQLSSNVNPGVD